MLWRATALFCCFVIAATVIARASKTERVPIRRSFAEFPTELGRWKQTQELPFDQKVLTVLGVDDYVSRVYMTTPREGVGLYIGYYKSQREGDAIHSPLNCLPGSGWEPVKKSAMQLTVPQNSGTEAVITINRYMVQKGLDRQLVLYWYQSHGRVVASEYWSKFYLIADAVRMNRTDAALVRVITPAPEGAEQPAEALAIAFVRTLFPVLTRYLPT